MRFIKSVSIYTKFLAVFIMGILLLSAAAFGMYNQGFRMINQEIVNHNSAISRNLSDNLTNEFRRILALQYDLSNNWELTKLGMNIGEFSNYERSKVVIEVQDKTESIKTSSQLIDSISVFLPVIGKTITSDTVQQISHQERLLLQEYDTSIQATDEGIYLISEFPYSYKTPEKVPRFAVVGFVSRDNIIQYVDTQSVYSEGEGFLYHPESEILIGNKDLISREHAIVAALELDHLELEQEAMSKDIQPIKVDGDRYHVSIRSLGVGDLLFVRYVDTRIAFAGLRQYRLFIALFFLFSFVAVLIFAKVLKEIVHRPLEKLVHAFEEIAKSDDVVHIHHHRNDEFKYIYESFNRMSGRIHTLVEQVLKQELLVNRAEIKQLQAQINPHFLYNSFLTLSYRIEAGDLEFASRFSRDIGKFFMYVTRNTQELVTLRQEVEYAELYGGIQYARFRNRMTLHFDPLPEEFFSLKVPRLIIQPILENSFEHALESSEVEGELYMSFYEEGEFLSILISDNGFILDETILAISERLESKDGEVTGMINIHRRLRLRYGRERSGITVQRSPHGGLEVRITIPKDEIYATTTIS